jgi:hypothetical protein
VTNFAISGTSIKNPSSFKIERYNVTSMERLANATMTGDLIAKKLKFYFTYDAISSKDLDTILNVIWESNSLFFRLDYIENGEAKFATVYVGSIPTELHRASSGTNWVWKNVTFSLIEQ